MLLRTGRSRPARSADERRPRRVIALFDAALTLVSRREERDDGGRLAGGGPMIVVANHLSAADPVTLGCFLARRGPLPRFLATDGLFRAPVVGAVVRLMRCIPVARGTAGAGAALTPALAALHAGQRVVVYPEGGVVTDRDGWPAPGRTGAARLALATGAPVVPVAQWGPQDLVARGEHAWRRWALRLLRRPRVRIAAGDPVDLSAFAGRPVTGELLAAATAQITAALTAGVAELRGEPAPVSPR